MNTSSDDLRHRYFFADHVGNRWWIRIDATAILGAKELAGVDLEQLAHNPADLGDLVGDLEQFAKFIGTIAEPRTTERILTFDVVTVSRAAVCFLKSLHDRFPGGCAKEALRVGNKFLRQAKQGERRRLDGE